MEFDVAIVGCGPTGAVLANLLGALGCRVAVVERDVEVVPFPRATHVDEETLRHFQATGLMPRLEAFTSPFGMFEIADGDGAVIFRQRVADPTTRHGYAESRFFDQPAFERILREGLARFANVTPMLGVEAVAIEEGAGWATVRLRDSSGGEARSLRASWVVGCDGGRSLARSIVGAELEALGQRQRWLVVDTVLGDDAAAALLPGCFRYFLTDERLLLHAHGFGRHRRWEFQLDEDEAPPDDATLGAWIARFLDPARLTIRRITTYHHTAVVARPWRRGRVLLAGDAAHMIPPTAGQGLCAGVRDAVNLAWKLDLVVRGAASPALLDSYERERRPHVCAVTRGALFLARRLVGRGAIGKWRRRFVLRVLNALPTLRELLRPIALPRPPLAHGMVDARSPSSGRHLPQPRVQARGRDALLDDVLGYRFALLVRPGVALPAGAREEARARGIGVYSLGDDLVDRSGELHAFFRTHHVDLALVRPDRYLFGAARLDEWPRLRRALDAQLVAGDGPAQKLEPAVAVAGKER